MENFHREIEALDWLSVPADVLSPVELASIKAKILCAIEDQSSVPTLAKTNASALRAAN